MNTETNQFEGLPVDWGKDAIEDDGKYIAFSIGEYVTIHGYDFRICEINVSQNRLVLLPIGKHHVRVEAGK